MVVAKFNKDFFYKQQTLKIIMCSYFFTCIPTCRKPFSEFVLDHAVVQRLVKMGFSTAFEIQDKTLPLTLEGRWVVVTTPYVLCG